MISTTIVMMFGFLLYAWTDHPLYTPLLTCTGMLAHMRTVSQFVVILFRAYQRCEWPSIIPPVLIPHCAANAFAMPSVVIGQLEVLDAVDALTSGYMI